MTSIKYKKKADIHDKVCYTVGVLTGLLALMLYLFTPLGPGQTVSITTATQIISIFIYCLIRRH